MPRWFAEAAAVGRSRRVRGSVLVRARGGDVGAHRSTRRERPGLLADDPSAVRMLPSVLLHDLVEHSLEHGRFVNRDGDVGIGVLERKAQSPGLPDPGTKGGIGRSDGACCKTLVEEVVCRRGNASEWIRGPPSEDDQRV